MELQLTALPRAESWLGTSAIFIWRRLLRKQPGGKDEEMGGGGQGWTDWARPTQTQEVPLLCGKCFIIPAKAFLLSHRFLFMKDPPESICYCQFMPLQKILSMETFKLTEAQLVYPSAHTFHSGAVLSGFIWKNGKHLFEQRGCKLMLQESEASRNIRKTEESLWRAANNITNLLQ